MTLLELMTAVCDELALQRPTSVISSTDPQIRQLLALTQRLGRDLCKQFGWNKLDKEWLITTKAYTYTGTTTAGSAVITGLSSTTGLSNYFTILGDGIMPFAQVVSVDNSTQVTMDMPATESGTVTLQFNQNTFPFPSDYDHEVPQTEWNRSTRWNLQGPKSPQEWQIYKGGIVSVGPRQRFRIWNNALVINPSPPDGQSIALEYQSKAFVIGADNVSKSSFTADTDTCVFTDSLMITGQKVLWKQAKGLDFSFDIAEFKQMLEQCKSQDKSAPRLYLAQAKGSLLLTPYNIQDGYWSMS